MEVRVNSSELFPNTYNVFRKDRPLDNKGRAYGGVLIAAKNNFICVQRQDLDSNCELLWVEIKITGAKPVLVGSFYCTPNEKIEYLSYLRESLTKIDMNQYSNIWLAGDFNLGDIDWSTQSVRPGGKKPTMCRELIDIANDYGLEQIVDKPTRKDRTLDLFFIRNSSLVIKSTVLPGISDHDGIPLILLNTKPSKNKQKPRKVFMYQKANVTELKVDVQQISNDFSEKDVSTSNANDLWLELKDKLHTAVDKHVPSKTVGKRNNTPWINHTLKRLHKRKQRAYNTARKSGKEEDWEKFRQLRKKIKKATRNSYRKYVRKICLESTKQFWNFVKSLKKDNTGISALKHQGELITDTKQKVEILNNQYRQQFTQERLSDLPKENDSGIPSMPEIKIEVEGVIKLLNDLSPFKAAGPDEISPWVLKTTAQEIGSALTIIFQRSLDTGVVPQDWLYANITPIFKKGDRTNPANYRSVNLTSVCSKIMEHVLHTNIMNHLDTHEILCYQQHGFRKAHSCETQLLSTTQDIAADLDKRRQIDIIIMDFTKAFDKVPHQRLLMKLWRYGIRGNTHKWITSFLTQRKQRVVMDGEFSDWVRVESSVPQGTVTGPLFFLLFINDLPDGISTNVRLFADDCILYTNVASPEDAGRLQADLDKLTEWQDKWQMDFNAKKCYVLRITHAKQPQKYTYTLNNTELQETQTHTYLGVDLSHDLTWNSHINRIATKANRTLGFLRRNIYQCPTHIKDMAYKTLVRPILDYCSSVWDPHTSTLIKQLESIQNRAARFVSGVYTRKSSVTAIKQDLNWEPLQHRRKVDRLTNFQQAVAGKIAFPVQNVLRPVGRSTRRSSTAANFITIQTNKDCYKYAFLPRTLVDWNSLPSSITTIQDKKAFKTAVNHHLLQK